MRRCSMSYLLLAPLLVAQADAAGSPVDPEPLSFSFDAGSATVLRVGVMTLPRVETLVPSERRSIDASQVLDAGHIILVRPPREDVVFGHAPIAPASGEAFLITSPSHSAGSIVLGSGIPFPLVTTASGFHTGQVVVRSTPSPAAATVVPLPASAGLLALALAGLAGTRKRGNVAASTGTSTASKFR